MNCELCNSEALSIKYIYRIYDYSKEKYINWIFGNETYNFLIRNGIKSVIKFDDNKQFELHKVNNDLQEKVFYMIGE